MINEFQEENEHLESLAQRIFYVEFKMSQTIGPSYKFLKFWTQWTFLKEHYEEQNKK